MRDLPKPTLERTTLDGLPVLTDEALFEACGVRIAFTGRAGGVSVGEYAELNMGDHVGDDPCAVEANRRRVLAALGTPDAPLICPNQVHGTEAAVVREQSDLAGSLDKAAAGCDIVAVGIEDVASFINAADCLVLIVVSPTGRFVVAHAGWRGALAGVASIAVRTLTSLDAERANAAVRIREHQDGTNESANVACQVSERRNGAGESANSAGQIQERSSGLNTNGAEIADNTGDAVVCASPAYNVYLGPHIRSECFEVGEEVAALFAEAFGNDVVVRGNHVDLARAVSRDLMRAGIYVERIADSHICTKCNPDQYFSYRASEGCCGRHAAAAVRIGKAAVR